MMNGLSLTILVLLIVQTVYLYGLCFWFFFNQFRRLGWRFFHSKFLVVLLISSSSVLVSYTVSIFLVNCGMTGEFTRMVLTLVGLTGSMIAGNCHAILLYLRSDAAIMSRKIARMVRYMIVAMMLMAVIVISLLIAERDSLITLGSSCFGYSVNAGIVGSFVVFCFVSADIIYGYYFRKYLMGHDEYLTAGPTRVTYIVAQEGIKTTISSLNVGLFFGLVFILSLANVSWAHVFFIPFFLSQTALATLWIYLKIRVDRFQTTADTSPHFNKRNLDQWKAANEQAESLNSDTFIRNSSQVTKE